MTYISEPIDFSKYPFKVLSPEDQIVFERRAHSVDDNQNPPVIYDSNGDLVETIDDK